MWVAFQGWYATLPTWNRALLKAPLLDGAVIDDVARGRLDQALGGAPVVGHAIALGSPPRAQWRADERLAVTPHWAASRAAGMT
jgi:hypothetical protein